MAQQSKLERDYQSGLVQRLYDQFPGCFVQKLDSSLTQGIPDLLVLWRYYWAVLEVKAYEGAPYQPNQQFYLQKLGEMSFAATIYPENEAEVLRELQEEFQTRWVARLG